MSSPGGICIVSILGSVRPDNYTAKAQRLVDCIHGRICPKITLEELARNEEG